MNWIRCVQGKIRLSRSSSWGYSHIQAGHLSGRVMRLLPTGVRECRTRLDRSFKLSKTNEPDDYFIKSVAKDWIAGRCIQHVRKTPIGIGGIGIKSVSPSINFGCRDNSE